MYVQYERRWHTERERERTYQETRHASCDPRGESPASLGCPETGGRWSQWRHPPWSGWEILLRGLCWRLREVPARTVARKEKWVIWNNNNKRRDDGWFFLHHSRLYNTECSKRNTGNPKILAKWSRQTCFNLQRTINIDNAKETGTKERKEDDEIIFHLHMPPWASTCTAYSTWWWSGAGRHATIRTMMMMSPPTRRTAPCARWESAVRWVALALSSCQQCGII